MVANQYSADILQEQAVTWSMLPAQLLVNGIAFRIVKRQKNQLGFMISAACFMVFLDNCVEGHTANGMITRTVTITMTASLLFTWNQPLQTARTSRLLRDKDDEQGGKRQASGHVDAGIPLYSGLCGAVVSAAISGAIRIRLGMKPREHSV